MVCFVFTEGGRCLHGMESVQLGAQLQHHSLQEPGWVGLQGNQRRLVTRHKHLLHQARGEQQQMGVKNMCVR